MVWQNGTSTTVTNLYQQTGSQAILPSGVTTPINLINVGQYASYDMTMQAVDVNQSTAGHALTFSVLITWYDDTVSGIPVFAEQWTPFVMGQNPTHPNQGVFACGPMHGEYMSVTISNPSSVGTITLPYLNLFGSSRPIPLSDWRQSLGNHVSDNKLAKINSINNFTYNNVLADSQGLQPIVAGDTYMMALGLYSGPIYYYFQASATGVNVTLAIIDLGNDNTNQVSGSISASDGQLSDITLSSGGTLFQTGQLFLPRNGCALYVGCTGSGNVAAKIVAQQGP